MDARCPPFFPKVRRRVTGCLEPRLPPASTPLSQARHGRWEMSTGTLASLDTSGALPSTSALVLPRAALESSPRPQLRTRRPYIRRSHGGPVAGPARALLSSPLLLSCLCLHVWLVQCPPSSLRRPHRAVVSSPFPSQILRPISLDLASGPSDRPTGTYWPIRQGSRNRTCDTEGVHLSKSSLQGRYTHHTSFIPPLSLST